jgi:nucleotidyltransferase substrate binding protein (TIGR01987 family)
VELAWKSIKEYLEDQCIVLGIPSPRGILKEAYAAGIIHDAETWNQILTARNLTSHVYDEQTSIDIACQICNALLPPLDALAAYFKN